MRRLLASADLRNALVLLALGVLLWSPRLRGPIDLRYDAGVYYLLGTSLAEGRGYRLLNEPGEAEAVQYPPLLPAFVAAHQKLAGTSDPAVVGQWLRVSYCAMFLLYVLASYVLARQFVGRRWSLLVGVICCVFHYGLFMSNLLFAEIPFALLTTAFVIVNTRAARASGDAETSRTRRALYFTAASVCAVAAYLLRSAGLAVLAAWVGESVVRRKWRQAAARTAVALVPVLAWQAHISRVTTSDDYRQPAYPYQRAAYQYYNVTYVQNIVLVDPFRPELGKATPAALAGRVVRNLAAMPAGLGEAVTAEDEYWRWFLRKVGQRAGRPSVPLGIIVVPLFLVGCLTITGGALLLARREWFIPTYLAASVGLICLTPWPEQFTRYLSPLTPFVALCLVTCLAAAHEYAARRAERSERASRGRAWRIGGAVAVASVVAGVLGMEAFATAATYRAGFQHVYAPPGDASAVRQRLFFYDDKWAAFDEAVSWLGARLSPQAAGDPPEVLCTSSPHWAHLKTGGLRKAVMPPMEADPAKSQAMLDAAAVKYVIVDDLGFLDIVKRYTRPTIEKYPVLWDRVYTVPGTDTHVYRRTAAPTPALQGGGS